MANIKFILNGCDISFVAEAPEDNDSVEKVNADVSCSIKE